MPRYIKWRANTYLTWRLAVPAQSAAVVIHTIVSYLELCRVGGKGAGLLLGRGKPDVHNVTRPVRYVRVGAILQQSGTVVRGRHDMLFLRLGWVSRRKLPSWFVSHSRAYGSRMARGGGTHTCMNEMQEEYSTVQDSYDDADSVAYSCVYLPFLLSSSPGRRAASCTGPRCLHRSGSSFA